MRRGLFLSIVLALAALCSASSLLPGSVLARDAAAASDPVSNPQPASTLLSPGTTALDLSVDSAAATDCAWSLKTAKPYSAMTRFSSGAGSTSHSTRVTGLDQLEPNSDNPPLLSQNRNEIASLSPRSRLAA